MAKINILPASVYNRIAAGEVVDRPYSVVKELVENSIDAGATDIEIYVENGGKQLIRVVDNGSGITRDDLQSAFLPHATSKIKNATDLESIMTLGFRGEAVASISAVSKMTITSKVDGANCYSLTCDGGELGTIKDSAGYNGTDVKVEMLFYNTPVRLGFLKADKSEETDIINFVSRFILNRTDISFKLYVNEKLVLQSFGGGEEEAIADVYGASVLKNCYRIQADKHGIKIRGYIGNQNFSKPNKTYQSIFLNGRYIVNQNIATALSNAYGSYLMKRQYPFYVLHIDVPPEIVDVNVHPNKADVRFADNRLIYGCIYNVVSAVLDGNSSALNYIVNDNSIVEPIEENVKIDENVITKEEKKVEFTYEDAKRELQKIAVKEEIKQTKNFDNVGFFEEQEDKKVALDLPFDIPTEKSENTESEKRAEHFINKVVQTEANDEKRIQEKKQSAVKPSYDDLFYQGNAMEVNSYSGKKIENKEPETDFFAENKKFLEEQDRIKKQNRIDVKTCNYVGKMFNTYVMFERNEEVYIIDQHAAHERLIYNRLTEKMSKREVISQPMLLPYQISLNAFETRFIEEHLDNIRSLGFEIEEFGLNTYKISAVPVDLKDIDIGKFFNDILGDINGYKSIKLENILKDKLATAACKAAVKGGMDLTQDEIDELFRLMDGDMGLKCPHGRPVVVKLTKTELEKMFKRIV